MSLNALIRRVKPQEVVFFNLLDSSAANLLEAVTYFDACFQQGPPWGEMRNRMKELEHRGDALTMKTMDRLHRIFSTPIEREDIIALAHALDDALDNLYSLCEVLLLYKVETLPTLSYQISALLVQAAEELPPLMKGLRTFSQTEEMHKRVHRITVIENQTDTYYNQALAELFATESNPVLVIKGKEVLDHLEETCDLLERVGKLINYAIARNA